MTNEYLAPFVDELFNLGVREAVFSPGSRSTALAMLFEEYKKNTILMSTLMNVRLLFFALGIAKAKKRPVVLVCTSGSAAAHHFPAVLEAKMSRVPLIILTADRPAELQFVGAPQTVDQTDFLEILLIILKILKLHIFKPSLRQKPFGPIHVKSHNELSYQLFPLFRSCANQCSLA